MLKRRRLLVSLALPVILLLLVCGFLGLQNTQAQHWGWGEFMRYRWNWPQDPDPGPWTVEGTHQFEYGDYDQSPLTEFEIQYEVWKTGVVTAAYLTLEPGLELAPTEKFYLVAYAAVPEGTIAPILYEYTWSKRHHTIWISTTIVTSKTIDFTFYDCDESSIVWQYTIDLETEGGGSDYRIDFDNSRVTQIGLAWEYYRTSWDQGALITIQQVDGVDIGVAYGETGEYHHIPETGIWHLDGVLTNIPPTGCTGPVAKRRGTGVASAVQVPPTPLSEPPPPPYEDRRDPTLHPGAIPEPAPDPQNLKWYVQAWRTFIGLLRKWGILPEVVDVQTGSGWYVFRGWLVPQSVPTPTSRPPVSP